MSDLCRLSALELSARYADHSVSPVEATQAALDAIERFDGDTHAFVLVDPESALAHARQSEARWQSGTQLGAMDGIPTSIKDIFLSRDWPALRGSELIDAAGPWPEDAPAVARLREGGAVFIGKTATPEFAWKGVTDSLRFGATGNAWDPALTPGGSSGGSATAVALGMGTWSIGTDGGGSVRIPASFTGTVALKPTYGLIPHYPASPFGTLAHAGPMTRTVAETAAMLDILTGFDHRDWSAMPTPTGSFLDGLDNGVLDNGVLDNGVKGLRIGFSADLGFVRNDPEVERLVRAAVQVLAELGAVVDEVDPGFGDPVEAFDVLWNTGAAKVLEAYGPGAIDRVDPGLRRAVESGMSLSASDFLDAMAVRMNLGQRMGAFHRTYDVLVTPTLPITAFPTGTDAPRGSGSSASGSSASGSSAWTSWTPYTYPFNMTQQPALSVPCGLTEAGLPVGMHIVGPRHGDRTVLRAGRAYETATSWSNLLPTLARQ